MRTRFSLLGVLAALLLSNIIACEDAGEPARPMSEPPPSAAVDAGEDHNAHMGHGGGTDAAIPDSTPGAVNGCMAFDDKTADADPREIVWVRSVGTKCYRIKVGQKVTWNPKDTSFTAHPLLASGGDSPSPITNPSDVAAPTTITFSAAGTFGFVCVNHPDMTGAILVEP